MTVTSTQLEARPTDPSQRLSSVPDSEDFEQPSAFSTALASPETGSSGTDEDEDSTSATDNSAPTSPILGTGRHDEARTYERIESPLPQSSQEFHARELHMRELTTQTEFYRQESMALQKRNEDLQRQVDAMKEVEAMKSDSEGAELKAKLAQSYEENQYQLVQLNNKAALQPFTKREYKYPLGPEKKAVIDAISSIEADTFNLLVCLETTDGESKVDLKEKSPDLSVLWTAAFGDPAMKFSGIPLQAVIRSLTSAALCKWVFETHLDELLFANCYRGKVILQHIAEQGAYSPISLGHLSDSPQMDRKSLVASNWRHSRRCTTASVTNSGSSQIELRILPTDFSEKCLR